jgi:hypothetical protein
MVATACRCWVKPIAQQNTVRWEVRNIAATRSSCSRSIPVASTTVSRSTVRVRFSYSSKPAQWPAMKSRSTTVPGASSSASSSSLPSPANSAMSPPSRIWTNSSAIGTPSPTTPRTFCGSLNRIKPASGSGLTAMILAPLAFAFSRIDSIRGWLVPGFWPAIRMQSACATSSTVTEPLPMPMDSLSAVPDDSWHMFEQSGRLLVPKLRTRS